MPGHGRGGGEVGARVRQGVGVEASLEEVFPPDQLRDKEAGGIKIVLQLPVDPQAFSGRKHLFELGETRVCIVHRGPEDLVVFGAAAEFKVSSGTRAGTSDRAIGRVRRGEDYGEVVRVVVRLLNGT